MKTFDRDGKFNFVDDNNVFIGFDAGQDCCEHASWFISVAELKSIPSNEDQGGTKGYQFDTSYFETVDTPDTDEGGMVRFRLVNPEGEQLFLHLFNCHNGYYGHGFTATIGGQPWQEGCL